MIKIINIGDEPNDGMGEDLQTGFDKCNKNFKSISKRLHIKLKFIYWENIEDTREAFSDINDNFEKIFKRLKI